MDQAVADLATYALVALWGLWQLAALAEGVRCLVSRRGPGPARLGLKNPGARRLIGGTLALPVAYMAAATLYGIGGCTGGLKHLAECAAIAPALGQAAYNAMLVSALLGPGLGMLALIGAAILELLTRRGG
ncbi:MAG: hypothetical protein AAGC57_12205 [Pseudomonadota bacterium]